MHPGFLVSLAVISAGPCAPRAGDPERNNVLLVVMDDVGVDRVATYGAASNPPSTPTLDGLAAGGVLFERCWATPFCSPSRAAILTGRHGFRTGVGHILRRSGKEQGLPDSEWALPRALARATEGVYRSAALGKWHLAGGGDDPGHALAHGFERYAGCPHNLGPYGDIQAYRKWTKVVDGEERPQEKYVTTDTADDLIAAFEEFGDEPWLLYVAFHAAHTPFHRPPKGLYRQALSGYPLDSPVAHHKAMVEAMDHELGRALESMDEALRRRTTVIVIGDNGTPRPAVEGSEEVKKGKGSLFEAGVRVPLIIAGAGVAEGAQGRRCAALVSATDLFATVLELCGVELDQAVPEGVELDCFSLLPQLLDPETRAARSWLYSEYFLPNHFEGQPEEHHVAITRGRYKLIRNRIGDTDRLFDLQADPRERDNLLRGTGASSEELQQARAELRAALVAILGAD